MRTLAYVPAPKEELNVRGRDIEDWREVNVDWVDGDPGAVE